MVRIIAPNGAEFEAADEMAARLLAAGWKRADEPKKPAQKRAGRKTKE